MRQSTIDKYTDLVIDLYVNHKMPLYKIAEENHVWDKTIKEILIKNNIKLRTRSESLSYPINPNYFEKIDSNEKSYFLGWLATDGFSNPITRVVGLSINEKDRKIIELFKRSIEAEVPIEIIKNSGFSSNYNMCRLRVSNGKISSDLHKLGISKNKSYELKFPILDEKYFYPFMRGAIEGDGEIRIVHGKNGKTIFSLCLSGTKDFLKGFTDYFGKMGIYFSVSKKRYKSRDGYYYRIFIQNKLNIIKILDKMYENHNGLFLDRKYNVYLKMKEFLKENPIKIQYITSKLKNTNFD